ncbi:HAD-IIIC family phosphatase [Streptomyces antibioticus]|uniref:FkbH-like protein n=1 Tax=Streptomyces antibioticus TaxID=1890 RepID=A0AAE7CKV5_STRAT|nr:HAD-IIIC family phosphatase [Streptomyces antibioticus]OOQ52085.1 FkbH-like protein [Streptomyces antibioticus]QIT44599.1 HAD-IIIC family phosphatase [Streptomyces antibioticus]
MTGYDPDSVKCVVWDLDGTLWDDIAVETPTDELPTPRPEMLAAIDALAARGVLSSIASRSAPTVLDRLAGRPEVRERFLAPQVSWQDKSESLRRIAKDLGIAVEALVLVDDSPYERAEVEALLPGVRTLAPEDVPALLAAFEGREVTPESRERVRRYRTEETRRAEGERFSGSREEFLRWCDMRLTIGAAAPDEIPRALELAARTHRLNSSGLTPDRLRELAASEGHALYTARMADRFGSYGVIGAALVDRTDPAAWSVPLLALSCRVAGRGAAAAFLFRLMRRAREAGADTFQVTLRPTDANLEMRILLRQAGLRRADDTPGTTPDTAPGTAPGTAPATAPDAAVLVRSLHGDLPEPPPYLHVTEQDHREDAEA